MALIAVIDDDPDILEASTLILEANGHKVITASNPTTGYEVVVSEKPDLIILDVMMDEADDGFFLAQRLRKDKIKTPILMYTSISKAIGLQFGANDLVPVDDFVEKPISPEELIRKVKNLL
ncbi:MAG: response regulator [Ignavibacteriales bacterium]|nr:response regulator [Ignavibacteriales bacterium]MBK7979704.1 response regulator [Ignavibacteriota bacterium]